MRKKISIYEIEIPDEQDIYIEIPVEKYHQILSEISKNEIIILPVNEYYNGEQSISKAKGVQKKYNHNEHISQFKEHPEMKWKNTVLDNLKKAIMERGNRAELIKAMAEEWKYQGDENSKTRGINLILGGKQGNILAQDLLILEAKFGIHRDEVLGEIKQPNRGIYMDIENLINRYPEDEDDIRNAFRAAINVFKKKENLKDPTSIPTTAINIKSVLDKIS